MLMKVSNVGFNVNIDSKVVKVNTVSVKADVKVQIDNAAEDTVSMKRFCNTFVLCQVITSMASSFVLPFAFYSIVLLPFSTNVVLLSARPLIIYILTPWWCSFLSPLSLPMSWPEALKKKHVFVLPDNYFENSEKCFLFLRHDRIYKFGIIRNLIIGTYLAILWVPIAIIFCIICGPVLNIVSFISFISLYVCLVSGCTIPLSIISYSIFSNNNRVMSYMKSYPSYLRTMSSRIFYSAIC